ncbi:hypothetical protein FOMPIDRAFT_1137693 [Fomitopsis schrenkii]|uniref:Uncharacterized protein n=1 Tax=Fomitopsis schrenkii TaxID=2126942 RepID=S8DHN3_FOMSC|nr:hypothetical protein FOMPIDRAFT_1137693 [Fomitopsis schrenkii]
MDASELDARIRCLPPAFGTRHFKNGIFALSQVSGSERKDMARILLGCLVGRIPTALMLTLRSLLDFIYISQYPTHDDITLSYLEDALKVYHKNKKILKTLGIRKHMNIPKFHSLLHYVEAIRSLGTTDNYNTEMFERLHIDCAKKAWRASNHRNERPQMVRWLERQEKMAMYESMRERLYEDRHIYELKLGRPLNAAELEQAPSYLPFSRLNIFHGFVFTTIPLSDSFPERDAVKARPACGDQPARFDTAVVLQGDEAEATGLQGTRIGRVKIIFKLPETIHECGTANGTIPAPQEWKERGPLAYVEWFAKLPAQVDPVHMMYEVKKMPLHADGTPAGAIVPLSMIRQSCQLIPHFPKPTHAQLKDLTFCSIPTDWTTDTVLDKASRFVLNNWASKYSYQTLW